MYSCRLNVPQCFSFHLLICGSYHLHFDQSLKSDSSVISSDLMCVSGSPTAHLRVPSFVQFRDSCWFREARSGHGYHLNKIRTDCMMHCPISLDSSVTKCFSCHLYITSILAPSLSLCISPLSFIMLRSLCFVWVFKSPTSCVSELLSDFNVCVVQNCYWLSTWLCSL